MSDVPAIYVLITTYKRPEIAARTIKALKNNLLWSNIGYIFVDDGSPEEDIEQLIELAKPANYIWAYRSNHKGVGHNMNVGLQHIFGIGGTNILLLEDDWELTAPFDPAPYIQVMQNYDVGLIRLGYISPGLQGELVSLENKLWWSLVPNANTQYTYVGHAGFRHRRLFERVGMFSEGFAPGENELDYCAKVDRTINLPSILWPADYGCWGPFAHIGSNSLASIKPG